MIMVIGRQLHARAASAWARATPARSCPEDATAIAQLPGVQYVAAGSNTRAPDHRRQPELEHAGAGHRRRHAADPSWPVDDGAFFTPQDVTTASKVAVLGSVVARSAVRAGRRARSARSSASRNQPFTVVGVMASKGQSGHGPGSGRHGLRALHDRDEEAARHHLHPAGHGLGRVGGRDVAGRRQHRHAAARRATRSSRATRTTSWCGRWRRWRASARKRRRR